MLNLDWITSQAGTWLSLADANLASINTEGVYIIWQGGSALRSPLYVRVGQGVVADRIGAHRTDPKVLRYQDGSLRFTFATVHPRDRDGVEVYLATQLLPLVGDRFPQALPIPVNLPLVA